jgi:hypothetical protein
LIDQKSPNCSNRCTTELINRVEVNKAEVNKAEVNKAEVSNIEVSNFKIESQLALYFNTTIAYRNNYVDRPEITRKINVFRGAILPSPMPIANAKTMQLYIHNKPP